MLTVVLPVVIKGVRMPEIVEVSLVGDHSSVEFRASTLTFSVRGVFCFYRSMFVVYWMTESAQFMKPGLHGLSQGSLQV